jgi:Ca-activated chloride channel family protein
VFVEGLSGTLVTIAKDVKLQIEFNPAQVGAYRLIGYENRALAAEDFNNDARDAGDIGAGHSVTALYEIVPASELKVSVDPLKYQGAPAKTGAATPGSDELFTLKLRYKQPDGETSQKIEIPCKDRKDASAHPSRDFDWAAGVAAFGLLLRDSKYKGNATFDLALELAQGGKGADKHGYRAECIELMRKAKGLNAPQQPLEPPAAPPGTDAILPNPFTPAVPAQPAPAAPYAPGSTRSGPMR